MREFGKFRLVELLASGGMAEVWRAEMPGAAGFVKEIALKLVRGEHREDDAFTRMFIQEARLASRLDHANIVHVFELGQVEGHYYIAMELVRGRTLREVADRCHQLGIRFGAARAVHVCADVARALAYAHRLEVEGRPAGLVHRDVSPQNVLISFEGEVKLADFGIARAAGADELTRAGTIKGKLAYMAPEQARGEQVDARADVFALGVVLWELCTGRRLFAREGEAATLAALLEPGPVSPPSAWNEAVPPALDEAVLAALERDRVRRTASADELAAKLSALRLRLAAASPDDIDLRALLRRLWPECAASAPRQREPTAVMSGPPPVPVAAERGVAESSAKAPPAKPASEKSAPAKPAPASATSVPEEQASSTPGAEGVSAAEDAPTRTLHYRPRPFTRGQEQRRTLALLALVVGAIAIALLVLRWVDTEDRQGATKPARREARRAAEAERGATDDASRGIPDGQQRPTGPASSPTGPQRDAARSSEAAPPQVPESSADRAAQPPAESQPPASQQAISPEPGTQQAAPQQPAPQQPAPARPEQGAAAAAGGGAKPARARATLVVDVVPWATIYVDGEKVGDTPLTLQLPEGRHELRAVHPRLGTASARIRLAPGERRRWAPTLSPR